MPTYEYACPKCGHAFEHFQSMKDAPLSKCPKCRKTGLKRLIGGGAGLIFKGSGFYITDYKNKSGAKPGGEAAAEKSTPAEKSSASTPSTPAAKPDAKPAAAAKPAAK